MKRVVVTGLGTVNALGLDIEEFWAGLLEGRCGIRPLSMFGPPELFHGPAAQVPPFSHRPALSPREVRRLSRGDRFALAAADEAFRKAGLTAIEPERSGVVLGVGSNGMLECEEYYMAFKRKGERHARRSRLVSAQPASSTDSVARTYGLAGPKLTIMTTCSSSAAAIGFAADLIRNELADVMLTGGADALCRSAYAGFSALRALDPERCRPFDAKRQGLSLGEGAGCLVVEALEHARARGARVYAEFLGYGISGDAHHITAPHPEGSGAARAMAMALAESGLEPWDVGYINAHGTGTRLNDVMETKAIRQVFRAMADRVPVSSIKSMVGHALGAAGGIEAVATVLALYHGVLPPTAGYREADPECDLDYVPNRARQSAIRIALSNSFAFGGNNVCLAFGILRG